MTVRCEAPGSLLLAGEYAILESGGMGLSVAPDIRARCTADLEPGECVVRYGGVVERFDSLDAPGCPPVVEAVAHAVREHLRCRDREPALVETDGPRVDLDTSGFYEGSRKLGFGSSAAAALCLTAALLRAAGATDWESACLDLAVSAHRAAQNGRGSGYDVATSFCGGTALFTGGAAPSVKPVTLPWLPDCYLYRGPKAVSTGGSVSRYKGWKQRRGDESLAFLEQSNRTVSALAAARTWEEARSLLVQARALSTELGCSISVGADPTLYSDPRYERARRVLARFDDQDVFVKSLGAGNETGIVMVRGVTPPIDRELVAAGLQALTIAPRGVTVL